jgi:hypothetical protein
MAKKIMAIKTTLWFWFDQQQIWEFSSAEMGDLTYKTSALHERKEPTENIDVDVWPTTM